MKYRNVVGRNDDDDGFGCGFFIAGALPGVPTSHNTYLKKSPGFSNESGNGGCFKCKCLLFLIIFCVIASLSISSFCIVVVLLSYTMFSSLYVASD